MLVLDEQRLERNARGLAHEKYAHEVNQWTLQQLNSARVIADTDLSPINPFRQMGHMLPGCAAFEQLMTRCSPNFVYEEVLGNPTKKRLYFAIPGGERHYICLYEAGPTPEYSIMTGKYEWEPDPEYALGERKLERADVRGTPVTLQEAYDLIRDHGVEGAVRELQIRREGDGLTDSDYKPGFRKVLKVRSEAIRGWRTVLARAVQSGFVNLHDVKREIEKLVAPGADRASWAVRTGQIDVGTPIGF